MFLSIVLYVGLAILCAGAVSVVHPLRFLRIRTRRTAAVAGIIGLIIIATALAIPPREQRTASRASLLDDYMPVWQFNERHTINVKASPDSVFRAIHEVPADEIFLFRTLVALRRFGRSGPESILNAPERQSLIDVATRTTFVLLADAPPRELVVGTVVAAPPRAPATGRLTPDLFQGKLQPGIALATMNFVAAPDGRGGSVVSTETRVFANSPSAARRFAIYWRFIHPGSDIIRRMWLRAIKRRAEKRA